MNDKRLTASDLIAKLQAFPPEALLEVYTGIAGNSYITGCLHVTHDDSSSTVLLLGYEIDAWRDEYGEAVEHE